MLASLFVLCRPKQWAKNLLVFAALLFTGRWADAQSLGPAVLAFVAMCLVSSAIYAVNDVRDAETDRTHPRKRLRPVASGRVAPGVALGFALILLLAGVAIAATLGPPAWLVLGAYLGVQALYQSGLKAVVLADVFAVAAGFVLRAVFGAASISASISPWLLFCTGALALMLGFGKRRSDAAHASGASAGGARYPKAGLDALVVMSACTAAIAYGIYSIDSTTAARYPALLLTTPCVVYGIARYVLRVFSDDDVGEPADLLYGDPHIVFSIVAFLIAAVVALTWAPSTILRP